MQNNKRFYHPYAFTKVFSKGDNFVKITENSENWVTSKKQ